MCRIALMVLLATGGLMTGIFAKRAYAEQSLIEGQRSRLALGGYAFTLGGLQRLPVDVAPGTLEPPPPDHLGLSATVLRLEWKADLGRHVTVELHQRGYLRTSSEAPGGQKLGLGVSTVPKRTFDLRSVAYDEERLLLEHDIDRLAVRTDLGDVDVSIGRQAITWGFASLFPVADLWTTFSPFELDTSQKRGVDAIRVLYSHSRLVELEGVIADRGSWRDLSAGLRAVTYLASSDVYLAFTKQWRELIALAGAGAMLGNFKLRGDIAGPYDLDGRSLSRPRASLGADYMQARFTVTVEGHYNGTGVAHAGDYLTHLTTSPVVARGESYWLGRWYAGAAINWKLSELFQLVLTTLGNLQDPSLVLASSLTYQISQETSLSLGAFQGVGKRPVVGTTTSLRSELGSVGGLYYLSLSSFF
jgi:hypothetical protein